MSNYTPTTEEVLRCYQASMNAEQARRDGESFGEFLSRRSIETFNQQITDEAAARRWLAEVERAAAEIAWKRGYNAGCDNSMGPLPFYTITENPYRQEGGE